MPRLQLFAKQDLETLVAFAGATYTFLIRDLVDRGKPPILLLLLLLDVLPSSKLLPALLLQHSCLNLIRLHVTDDAFDGLLAHGLLLFYPRALQITNLVGMLDFNLLFD